MKTRAKNAKLPGLNNKDNPQPLMMAAVIEFFSRHFAEAEKLYGEASASNRTGGVEFLGSVRFLSAIGFIQKISGAHNKEGQALLEEARALDKRNSCSLRRTRRVSVQPRRGSRRTR